MAQLRGNVRFRFRSDDHDVNVVIEGESSWVQKPVEALGLTGVGWTLPTGTAGDPDLLTIAHGELNLSPRGIQRNTGFLQ